MEGRKMESSHLSLRWDDHRLTFVHLLDHFRLQELYCDASLACAGGGVYPVHKVVLSACSDFFASIFASASCQNPVVVLQDVGREELEALLTYVYRGEVLLPRPALPAFLKVAGSLQVKGLSPPPLTPLTQETRDAWSACSGVSLSPDQTDASRQPQPHPPPPYPQMDPPPYPRSDMTSSPERCVASWGEEGEQRSGAPLQQAARMRGGGQGDGEKQRPPRKRFSPHFAEQFAATFQNLVASEEGSIKEEPLDEEVDLYDSDRLTICEKDEEIEEEMEEEGKEGVKDRMSEEVDDTEREKRGDGKTEEREVKEEDNEGRNGSEGGRGGEEDARMMEVKIMLDTRQPPPPPPTTTNTPTGATPTTTSLPSLSPTTPHSTLSPTRPQPSPGQPALSPHSPTAPTTPSQLRRELLKPLQHRPAPPPPHHAILHPVMVREGDGTGVGAPREPPPLVKIPTSPPPATPPIHPSLPHPYSHHLLTLQPRQIDGRDTTTTTTTIPTSDTNSPSPHSNSHHHHHHLLVTSQPTYRNRMPAAPPHALHSPTQYPPPLTRYKGTDFMDTDTPLNLSQDPRPHRNPHHHHSTTSNTRAEQVERRLRDRDPFLGKILTNRKRRLRGPKSWEYLVRLLRDPTTNPALIRWENETKGVFRLVQPAAIAQRWGRRTGKHASECLTYENFARGLRYHYATGALEPVSERSFVYKFGPKALLALDDGEYGVTTTATTTAAAAAPAPAIATSTHL